jgi:hypothetical protein
MTYELLLKLKDAGLGKERGPGYIYGCTDRFGNEQRIVGWSSPSLDDLLKILSEREIVIESHYPTKGLWTAQIVPSWDDDPDDNTEYEGLGYTLYESLANLVLLLKNKTTE